MLAWACYSTAQPTLNLARYKPFFKLHKCCSQKPVLFCRNASNFVNDYFTSHCCQVGRGEGVRGAVSGIMTVCHRLRNTAGHGEPLSLSVSYFTRRQFMSVRVMSVALIWTYVSTGWRPLIPISAKLSVFGVCDHPGSRIADPA